MLVLYHILIKIIQGIIKLWKTIKVWLDDDQNRKNKSKFR